MIELTAISKTFNAGKPNRFTALRQIDLTLDPGQVTVFKGPSGSGKTTLLGIIGCMARPTSGRLRIQGREVTRLPELFLSRIRREAFGFVFQSFNLVTVDWFIEKKNSAFDVVIIVPEVKAADVDGDGTVTVEEMQIFYPKDTLVTVDMNFSISHTVVSKGLAFECNGCHGRNGWVLDWKQLGYAKDPGGGSKGGKKK